MALALGLEEDAALQRMWEVVRVERDRSMLPDVDDWPFFVIFVDANTTIFLQQALHRGGGIRQQQFQL